MTIYNKIDDSKKLVVGVGSALVDILVNENDEFVEKAGAVKGGMIYVDKIRIDEIVGLAGGNPIVVPGGSACNTVVGIGQLGGRARFLGKCGKDSMGQLICDDLKKQNVEPMLLESDSSTGRVLSVITPDAQRSMLTFLGASGEVQASEMNPSCFESAAIVHIEGYLLFNRDLFKGVIKAARRAGALISLDLASFNVVEEAKDELPGLVEQYIDILIANEDEAQAYTGIEDEPKALNVLVEQVDIAVLKMGARGSLVAHKDQRWQIQPHGDGSAVDTTGAGDLWASGFLFGLVNRIPLDKSADLGSLCGHAVCQVVGANIEQEQWDIIRNSVEERWLKNA